MPPYARRLKSLEGVIPILYLEGISTGDFEEALAAQLGNGAPGLSASTIARREEMWADAIYPRARLADGAQCIPVIIGATPQGKKEVIGFTRAPS